MGENVEEKLTDSSHGSEDEEAVLIESERGSQQVVSFFRFRDRAPISSRSKEQPLEQTHLLLPKARSEANGSEGKLSKARRGGRAKKSNLTVVVSLPIASRETEDSQKQRGK